MNEKGFSLVSILLFSSFLVGLFTCIGASGMLVIAWAKTHHICRRELLSVQKDLGNSIHQLFELNPEALQLEQEKEAAELEMVAEPNPVTAANIVRITVLQFALASRQRSIIFTAKLRAREKISMMSHQINKDGGALRTTSPILAVQPKNFTSIAPAYELRSNFERAQEVSANWKNRNWTGKCAATLNLTPGGTEWLPVLSTAKY